MKKVKVLIGILSLVFLVQIAVGQNLSQKFKMTGNLPVNVELNRTFTSSEEIFPFDNSGIKIYGLSISAGIKLENDESLVRILLLDKQFNEYLIYESYSLLEPATSFSIDEICEETAVLDGLQAYSVKIEISNAQITLKKLTYSSQSVPGLDTKQTRKEKKQGQNEEKISRINKNLKEKGLGWIAGPTEVSELTYAEKKQLFGQSTFPAGFEYYSGGVISTGISLKSASASTYVDNWDWRNRHGKNWISPIANQGACGSCWAFASTGATEAMVNVYFNRQLNLDLSEQDVLSCSGAGDCGGGYPGNALNYIAGNGVVDEGTFPYTGTDQPCANKGTNPSELIKIGGKVDFGSTLYPRTEDDLKRMLIEMGPVSGGLYDWSHAMVLVGYQVVKEGDVFYYRDLNLARSWKTVVAGDPLIGKTVWIFKNSWGPYFGDKGYVYVETPVTNFGWTHAIKTPVISSVTNYQVVCEDNDGDGYYWWGLGPKPATCTGPDTPDGNDADPTLGPLDQYGNCIKLNAAPVADFTAGTTVIFEGEAVSFTDLSTNNPISWSWIFDGGTPAASTLKNPTVTYQTAGNYRVVLTVTNSNGADTKTVENFITVNTVPAPLPLYADFTSDKTSITVGENVQFTDLSLNEPTGWEWHFQGGVPETSSVKNPKVTYNVPGEYDVTLVVSKPGTGNAQKIKTKYIVTNEKSVADYCTPVTINSSADYIYNVNIKSVVNNTSAGSGYSLYGNTLYMTAGIRYSIALTPKVSTNREYWQVWIDFNRDGDFNDSGETVISLGNRKGTLKSTVTIPATVGGTTRMRIAMSNVSEPGPCDDNYSGEVEDYTIEFKASAPGLKSAIAETEIQPLDEFDVRLYPNPVERILTLELESTQPGDAYTIYNIGGGRMVADVILSSRTAIDLSGYTPGVYMMVVENNKRVFSRKIVKK